MTADSLPEIHELLKQIATTRKNLKQGDQAARREAKEIGSLTRRVKEKAGILSRDLRSFAEALGRGLDQGSEQLAGLSQLITDVAGQPFAEAQQETRLLATRNASLFTGLGRSLQSDFATMQSKGWERVEAAHRRLDVSVATLQGMVDEAFSRHGTRLDEVESTLADARMSAKGPLEQLSGEITGRLAGTVEEAFGEAHKALDEMTTGRLVETLEEVGHGLAALFEHAGGLVKDDANRSISRGSDVVTDVATHTREQTMKALRASIENVSGRALDPLAAELAQLATVIRAGEEAARVLEPSLPLLITSQKVAGTIGDLLETMSFGLQQEGT